MWRCGHGTLHTRISARPHAANPYQRIPYTCTAATRARASAHTHPAQPPARPCAPLVWGPPAQGGHGNKDHWSNQLACNDLKQRLHERIARDLSHYRGKIHLYQVWKGALHWRDWIDRCGENLFFDAYRWAQQADPSAILCSSEASVLTTLTLTNAESYHNLVYRLKDQKVPIRAVCVQAIFEGAVDASTVKHRLDVLQELHLPVYITELSISNLDPAKHAYELEKFLRIAFSHEAVAGITLGDVWDRSATPSSMTGERSSGLYAANKQAKPAAARLDRLWKDEWHTSVQKQLGSDGSLTFDGYYGQYSYHLAAEDGKVCAGSIDLLARDDDDAAPRGEWGARGAAAEAQTFVVKCDWEVRAHPACGAAVPGLARLLRAPAATCSRVGALGHLPPSKTFAAHPAALSVPTSAARHPRSLPLPCVLVYAGAPARASVDDARCPGACVRGQPLCMLAAEGVAQKQAPCDGPHEASGDSRDYQLMTLQPDAVARRCKACTSQTQGGCARWRLACAEACA